MVPLRPVGGIIFPKTKLSEKKIGCLSWRRRFKAFFSSPFLVVVACDSLSLYISLSLCACAYCLVINIRRMDFTSNTRVCCSRTPALDSLQSARELSRAPSVAVDRKLMGDTRAPAITIEKCPKTAPQARYRCHLAVWCVVVTRHTLLLPMAVFVGCKIYS